MLKSTPARKKYTTAGFVVVTNISYDPGMVLGIEVVIAMQSWVERHVGLAILKVGIRW